METSDREKILQQIAEVEKQLTSLIKQQEKAEAILRSLREHLVRGDDQNVLRASSSSTVTAIHSNRQTS